MGFPWRWAVGWQRLAIGAVALAATACLAPAAHTQSSSRTPTGTVCATQAGMFLSPTEFDPQMVVSSQSGTQGPVGFGAPGSSSASPFIGGLHFLWMQVENERISGLPDSFGPLNYSPLVTQSPTRVFEVVETVQTFAGQSDATRFVGMFGQSSAAAPRVVVAGKLVTVTSDRAVNLGLGDESIAQERPSPSPGFPSEVQFVMRRGTTVATLELVGGSNLHEPAVTALAGEALTQVQTACSL
jgi:hypothetical protein